jgi:hypothetical protein
VRSRFGTVQSTVPAVGVQCGNCHFRLHTKRQCQEETCHSAESCNSLDKHPSNKKLVQDAADVVKTLKKELDKLSTDKDSKTKAYDSVKKTFGSQVRSHLINTDVERYAFKTLEGRFVKQALVNTDITVLEAHYRGKVPKNLDEESRNFKIIIASENKLNQKVDCPKNPVRKLLEDNTKYPVISSEVSGMYCI